MKKKEQKISVVETLNRISKSESGALSKVFELQQKESEEVCKKIAENNPLKSLLNIDFDKLRPHQPATKQDIKELLEKADKKIIKLSILKTNYFLVDKENNSTDTSAKKPYLINLPKVSELLCLRLFLTTIINFTRPKI